MSKSLAVATPGTDALVTTNTPDGLMSQIMAAADKGMAVDTLEKLMTLYERVESRSAEKEFYAELAEFQAEAPNIVKGRSAGDVNKPGTRFSFMYANLDDILIQLRPYLTKRGFSITFDQESDGKQSTATCIMRHRSGHTLRNKCTVPNDSTLLVGSQQKAGGAFKYAMRYALSAMLGIALTDEDAQPAAAPSPRITEEQAAALSALVSEVKPNLTKMKAHFGVESLSDMTQAQYPEAIRILEGLRKGATK